MVQALRVISDGPRSIKLEELRPDISNIPSDAPDEGQTHPTYVFESPRELQALMEALLAQENPTGLALSMDTLHKIRLCIVKTISRQKLTPEEEHGSIEGPNMAPLVQEWREAVKRVPRGHQICEVQFDMTCEQNVELREIVRLLQHISTVVTLKAAAPVKAFVTGCPEERKAWLEQSIVGAASSV